MKKGLRHQRFWAALAVVLLWGAALSGCAEETAVDLDITHDVSLLFGAVAAGAAPQVIVPFDNLRQDPVYASYAAELVCATLSPVESYLAFDTLTWAASPASVDVAVEVRPPGGAWLPLATLSGTPAERTTVLFTDSSVRIAAAGADFLAERSVADQPVFDARVTAHPNGGVDALTVTLRLGLRLSTDPSGCAL